MVLLFTFQSQSALFLLFPWVKNVVLTFCTFLRNSTSSFLVRLFDVPCFVFSRLSLFNFQSPWLLPLSATALLVYHILSVLSSTFWNFFKFSFRHFCVSQYSLTCFSSPCHILFYAVFSRTACIWYHNDSDLSSIFSIFFWEIISFGHLFQCDKEN